MSASSFFREPTRKGDAVSFGIYAIGFAILIAGLVYGAHLMHMPTHWIVTGAIVLLGVGILSGVKATRQGQPFGADATAFNWLSDNTPCYRGQF
jgi:hypothetical protein